MLFIMNNVAHANESLEKLHVIDWHVHIAGLGYGNSGAFINGEMRSNFRFNYFLKWMGVTEQELEEYGDKIIVKKLDENLAQSMYVDQAVILALDGVINEKTRQLDREKTQVYVPNDYVAMEAAKYPRLLFGASINPNRPDSIALLEKVHRQGAVLIKWIPSIMYIDPADKKFEPFYRKMAELNIPLLTHTGMEKSFASAKDELSDPKRLKLPLDCGVTVIAAHIATTGESEGQDNFERILPMFDEYDNLYTDISSLTQLNKLGYLAKAIKHTGLSERMIFGTDWPLQFFPVVSPWYHVRYIGIKNAWQISKINNKWDRDISIKKAYGIPEKVFTRTLGVISELLN